MGVIFIIGGIALMLFWAGDIQKGKENSDYEKRAHDHPIVGCLPYLVGILLIGFGVYLLV